VHREDHLAPSLPEDLITLMRQPSPCFLSTVMPDGSSHLTQTWVDYRW